MAIEYLKRGKPEADRAEDDAKTAAIVSATLKDIEQRGDTAVRELANKFDSYDRDSYRLTDEEIQAIIAKVSPEDMADIKFAQEQVRNFAQAQRDSMLDIEIETMPGVILGHKNIPVQSVGCYVPGGKFPMVASAHMSVLTANVAAMHLGGALYRQAVGGQISENPQLSESADRRGGRDGGRIRFASVHARRFCRPCRTVQSAGASLWRAQRGLCHGGAVTGMWIGKTVTR